MLQYFLIANNAISISQRDQWCIYGEGFQGYWTLNSGSYFSVKNTTLVFCIILVIFHTKYGSLLRVWRGSVPLNSPHLVNTPLNETIALQCTIILYSKRVGRYRKCNVYLSRNILIHRHFRSCGSIENWFKCALRN